MGEGFALDQIGYCGVDCAACVDLRSGKCPGCRESVWPEGDACPPVACCREREIACCGRCRDFPCAMMTEFYGESDSHRQAGERMQALHEAKGTAMKHWEKRTPEEYTVSRWSGGSTTQLAIAPEGAQYADRDFLWRVSSATVELEESDFTPLPDYDRQIATLRGEISLRHGDGAPIALRPYQVYRFDGGAPTHACGCCTDFNLMLRKGRADGTIEALRTDTAPLTLTPAAGETMLLYCVEGDCHVFIGSDRIQLAAGESLLTDSDGPLTVCGSGAALMLCRIRSDQ